MDDLWQGNALLSCDDFMLRRRGEAFPHELHELPILLQSKPASKPSTKRKARPRDEQVRSSKGTFQSSCGVWVGVSVHLMQ